MLKVNNWYVITGGPSSGKTTLLKKLEAQGHNVVHEVARNVIDEGLAKGLTLSQIRQDEQAFQHAVMHRKVAIENFLQAQRLTFFDRGLHDTIAYLKTCSYEIEDWIIQAVQQASYKTVFWLEPLANFERDYARNETKEMVQKLNQLLYDVYDQAGIKTVRIPAVDIDSRLKLVLNYINSENKVAA